MKARISRRSLWLAALISSTSFYPQITNATIVKFQIGTDTFEVNLYDNDTPATVANFLEYVNAGDYNDSIFHRSMPDFVVQGGGFKFDTLTIQVSEIQSNPSVVNEPVFANVRGTIAMAKLQNQPNSATNQWFFNLVDNTANLDTTNGGFTVFGEVVGNGMDVLNAIAGLPQFNLGGAFTNIPLRGDTTNNPLDETNYVIVNLVTISDTTVDSAAGSNPPLSTANSGGSTLPPPSSGGGGGGGFGVFALLGLLLAYRYRVKSIATTRN